MASLRQLLKHKKYARKLKVHLGPLSVGDMTTIAFAILKVSGKPMLDKIYEMKSAKKLPEPRPKEVFDRAIREMISTKRGIVYACVVTSIDSKNVFRGDQFAVALKRLGVADSVKVALDSVGLDNISERAANQIPWYWADLITNEVDKVKEDIKQPIKEGLIDYNTLSIQDELHIDTLITEAVMGAIGAPYNSAIKAVAPLIPSSLVRDFSSGIKNLSLPGQVQQIYRTYYRDMAQTRSIMNLNPNSSLDGIFEDFRQHILSDTASLQKLMPQGTEFGGIKLTTSQIQNIFRNKSFIDRLRLSLHSAHDKERHAISITRLYTSFDQHRVSQAVEDAFKRIGKRVSKNTIDSFIAGVIGLFVAFTDREKGR